MKEIQKIFNYGEIAVRTIIKDNEPWFIAKDVCEVLEIKNTTDVIKRLDSDEVTRFNLGGLSGEINIINESGLYELILTSRKPQAKPFKRWVKREVLPTIRKTGGYVNSGKEEEFIDQYFPSFSEEVKKAMVMDLHKKNLEMSQELSIARPKASYYDQILASNGLVTTTMIARDYGIRSAQQLNELLFEQRIQYKKGKNWFLYADYAEEGYMKSTTTQDGYMNNKWTQKGRLFLHQVLTELGYEPVQAILKEAN